MAVRGVGDGKVLCERGEVHVGNVECVVHVWPLFVRAGVVIAGVCVGCL